MLGWGTGCVKPEQRYVGLCIAAEQGHASCSPHLSTMPPPISWADRVAAVRTRHW